MLNVKITNKYKKDFNKLKIRLTFTDLEELFSTITKLKNKIRLEEKYCDLELSGNYKGFRDCHIKQDLILIYIIKDNDLILERLNSHSELF